MKDAETAKKLLLNSAELGCTYAMGYMSHLLNAGKAGFLGEDTVKKYHDMALEKMSPYACMWEGKPDDCCELTAFRNFRDSYLLPESEGRHLVERYYRIAPKIVQNIDALPERDCIYYEIWEKYLKKCMNLIQNNEPESCKNTYVEMVSQLEQKFL